MSNDLMSELQVAVAGHMSSAVMRHSRLALGLLDVPAFLFCKSEGRSVDEHHAIPSHDHPPMGEYSQKCRDSASGGG